MQSSKATKAMKEQVRTTYKKEQPVKKNTCEEEQPMKKNNL
jgi:hypothetical protein